MGELVSPGNAPFLVAICLMLAIGALEGLFLLVGGGLSHHLDALLAQLHFAHIDNDSGGVLGWLHIGRAPILVLLVIFLMTFAVAGLLMQWALLGLTGHSLQPSLASLVAAVVALPIVRACGGLIARHIPRDQTTAVSEDSFIGRVARLTSESASQGRAAQAKLVDEHGQVHYLLVEPDAVSTTFTRGEAILIVSRLSGSVFRGIRNPRPDLL